MNYLSELSQERKNTKTYIGSKTYTESKTYIEPKTYIESKYTKNMHVQSLISGLTQLQKIFSSTSGRMDT